MVCYFFLPNFCNYGCSGGPVCQGGVPGEFWECSSGVQGVFRGVAGLFLVSQTP